MLQTMDYIRKQFPYCNLVYLNKEDPYFDEIINDTTLWNWVKSKKQKKIKCFVFIDEVQEITNFEKAIGELGDKEIDFIGSKGDETIYIQVALNVSDEKTFAREFGNLLLIHDNHPKYVVTLDEYATGNHKGIIHCNLREFLTRSL
jgi:predicted AAA+ superfamily ATPase